MKKAFIKREIINIALIEISKLNMEFDGSKPHYIYYADLEEGFLAHKRIWLRLFRAYQGLDESGWFLGEVANSSDFAIACFGYATEWFGKQVV